LFKGNLRIEKGINVKDEGIGIGKRIGISKGKDLDYRFFIKHNEFGDWYISGPKKLKNKLNHDDSDDKRGWGKLYKGAIP